MYFFILEVYKFTSKSQDFPGNQVPEFPIFSRHVHKIMKLKKCLVGRENNIFLCVQTRDILLQIISPQSAILEV